MASGQRHASSAFIRQELARHGHTHPPTQPPQIIRAHTMTGRWPFGRKTKHGSEASGSASRDRDRRRMPPPRHHHPSPTRVPPQRSDPCRGPNAARPPRPPRLLRDRIYVPATLARRLYTDCEPVPWSDINLPAANPLNSRRVPVPPVPRDGPERVREICWRRALLPMHLWRDPAFDIWSSAWDTDGL
jgi:hypothetical protein